MSGRCVNYRSRAPLAAICLGSLFLAIPASGQSAPSFVRSGQTAPPSDSGSQTKVELQGKQVDDRLVYALPDSWIDRYWRKDRPTSAYIALVPPHAEDTAEEFAPGPRPSRVIMGYVAKDNLAHEKLLLCLGAFDDPTARSKLLSGLFGRLTRLSNMEVALRQDGTVHLTLYFQRGSPEPSFPAGQPSEAYKGPKRVRYLTVQGPRSLLPPHEAPSCLSAEKSPG